MAKKSLKLKDKENINNCGPTITITQIGSGDLKFTARTRKKKYDSLAKLKKAISRILIRHAIVWTVIKFMGEASPFKFS